MDAPDLSGAINELADTLLDAMEDSGLAPSAAVCASLQAAFSFVQDEGGLHALRDLFAQFDAGWRADRLGQPTTFFYQPPEGVLQ